MYGHKSMWGCVREEGEGLFALITLQNFIAAIWSIAVSSLADKMVGRKERSGFYYYWKTGAVIVVGWLVVKQASIQPMDHNT